MNNNLRADLGNVVLGMTINDGERQDALFLSYRERKEMQIAFEKPPP
jgi:hypothetical protein